MIIGVVGTRFAGLDGVTLETAKVAAVLESAGHDLVWFAGELGEGFWPGLEIPAAHFATPRNLSIETRAFGSTTRRPGLVEEIRSQAGELRAALEAFVAGFSVEAIMVQAALAIPMQLPLGLAITELLAETGLPTVAHHHDFAWERERFSPTAVPEILEAAFPPVLSNIQHLVINSIARAELVRRRGINSTVIPNVMDFANPPPPGDANRFRRAAGLSGSDLVLLQPTRPIPRKNIETTLELARELADDRIKVVVTHPEQDEGSAYWDSLVIQADGLGVDLRSVPAGGGEQPDLADAYAGADLVTYPSLIEGFGNALLEAFYFKRPVLVNRYPVYVCDIAPTGVRCIEMEDRLTSAVVDGVAAWLADPSSSAPSVEHNYSIGLANFSYRILEKRVAPLFGR